VISPLQARDHDATNLVPLLLCSRGEVQHVTITSNDGGLAADPHHRIVHLVVYGTMPWYCSSSGSRDHATVVWAPDSSFNIVTDKRQIKRKSDKTQI
jgi:hypothetical protein